MLVDKDGVCILDDNYIDLFKCVLDFGFHDVYFFLFLKLFHGMCVVALTLPVLTMSGQYFHPLIVMLLMSG